MECAVCKGKVEDFRLVPGDENEDKDAKVNVKDKLEKNRGWETQDIDQDGRSFMDSLLSSPSSGIGMDGLDSAFEFGLGLAGVRASTPKIREDQKSDAPKPRDEKIVRGNNTRRLKRGKEKGEENVVLRIDNVPWVRFLALISTP